VIGQFCRTNPVVDQQSCRQIVHPHDLVIHRQEALDEAPTDEAVGAGHEGFHLFGSDERCAVSREAIEISASRNSIGVFAAAAFPTRGRRSVLLTWLPHHDTRALLCWSRRKPHLSSGRSTPKA